MTLSATFTRILGLLKPHTARMLVALFAMMITAATEPAVASMMKLLLDKGFSETRSFSLWMVPVFVVGIFVVRGLSTFTTSYLMSSVSGMLMSTLRQQMFSRLLDVPLSYYRDNSTGKVISAMMIEVNQILDMIRNVMIVLIRDSLTVIGLLGYLLWLNWKLTLVTITLGPVIAFVVRLTAKRLKRLIQENQHMNAEITQTLEEAMRAQQVIKIFGGQRYEASRFTDRSGRLRRFLL